MASRLEELLRRAGDRLLGGDALGIVGVESALGEGADLGGDLARLPDDRPPRVALFRAQQRDEEFEEPEVLVALDVALEDDVDQAPNLVRVVLGTLAEVRAKLRDRLLVQDLVRARGEVVEQPVHDSQRRGVGGRLLRRAGCRRWPRSPGC